MSKIEPNDALAHLGISLLLTRSPSEWTWDMHEFDYDFKQWGLFFDKPKVQFLGRWEYDAEEFASMTEEERRLPNGLKASIDGGRTWVEVPIREGLVYRERPGEPSYEFRDGIWKMRHIKGLW